MYMKTLSRNIPNHFGSILLILVLVVFLLASPVLYSSVVSSFALLDQNILFNVFGLLGLLGLIIYVISNSKRVLGVPYAISAFIFGVSGYAIWPRLINLPPNVYLIFGVMAVSFVVFRRGLNVDSSGSKKSMIKSIFLGVILAIFSFVFINFVLKFIFPSFAYVLIYGLSAMLLMLGSNLKSLSLPRMDVFKFSFDMTILVILYNFLLFSSRLQIDSFLEIGKHLPFYSASFGSTVYGVLVGLIGAYLLHRHHLSWNEDSIKNEQNIYSIGLLFGILALSFLIGANPFISSGVMGLLVTMRDFKNNPEDHILSHFESYLGIFVFLILGSGISFFILGSLLAVSSGIVFLISLIFILALSFVLFILSKTSILPNLSYKKYLSEVLNRDNSVIFIGSLVLFLLSNSSGFNNLFITSCFVIIVCVYYIYPIFVRQVKN